MKTNDTAASWRKHPWVVLSAAMAVNLCLAFALAFAAANSFDRFWPALGTLSAVSFSVFIIALSLIRDLTESPLERAPFVIAGSFALTDFVGPASGYHIVVRSRVLSSLHAVTIPLYAPNTALHLTGDRPALRPSDLFAIAHEHFFSIGAGR